MYVISFDSHYNPMVRGIRIIIPGLKVRKLKFIELK